MPDSPNLSSALGDAVTEGREFLARLESMTQALGSELARHEETIAADLRFHHELVRLAGSERLTRAHETFADETRMLLRRHPPYPWRTYAQDHQQLVDALRRRDPNTAELVAQHLRLSARLLAGNRADNTEEGTATAD